MLFGKKRVEADVESLAKDKIILSEMKDDEEYARDLVLKLKDGNPLCLNFKNLDEDNGNKYLAFFIGASVALEGKTVKINEFTYLFARKIDFLDGSLKEWMDSIPKS